MTNLLGSSPSFAGFHTEKSEFDRLAVLSHLLSKLLSRNSRQHVNPRS